MAKDIFTYFVQADFGRGGLAWVERSVNDADRKTTIADIASGQWGDIRQILEVNPAENVCNDVTDELLTLAGLLNVDDQAPSSVEHAAWLNDRAYDERKHEVAV